MLDRVVGYLRSRGVSFRAASHPSPEALPAVAYAPPAGGRVVRAHVVLVGGRPALACLPREEQLNLQRLAFELGLEVTPGTTADLPAPFTGASEPVPPLGGLIGVTVLVDEALVAAPVIAFAAFAPTDFVELSYEDFAHIEQPRVASFSTGGELPEHEPGGARRVA